MNKTKKIYNKNGKEVGNLIIIPDGTTRREMYGRR